MSVTDFFDVVNGYGADPTGSADSTAAIDSAISAARALYGVSGVEACGAEIVYPPGQYSVSSINSTKFNGIKHRALGGPGSVIINGSKQTTPAPILDLTGTSAAVIDGIVFQGGNSTSSPPLCGILLAATSAISDSNKNRLDNCGSSNFFGSAALCIIGSSNNNINDCGFQQAHPSLPCLIVSVNPDWYIRSIYQTIIPAGQPTSNVGENSFIGCEFHMLPQPGPNSSCWTIYGRDIDNLTFENLTCSNSTPGGAHILLQSGGTAAGNGALTIIGGKFYSDTGVLPANILSNSGNLGRFISHGVIENVGYSGSRISGSTPSTNSYL